MADRVRLIWDGLADAWGAGGGVAYAWAVLLIIQGLLPAAAVTLTKDVVDSLTAVLTAGPGAAQSEALAAAILWVGLLAAVLLATELSGVVMGWVRVVLGERVSDHVRDRVHRQAVAVDYAFYESPAYFDRLNRVLGEAGSRPLAILQGVGALVQNAVTLLAFVGVLLPYGAWLPLALLASTVPAFWVTVRHKRRHHEWWETRTETTRRANYYSLLLTNSISAAEVRLFGLDRVFAPAFRSLRARLRDERSALERRQAVGRLGAAVLGLAAAGGAMAWVGLRALSGAATLGDIALFYQVFQRGQGLARTLLGGIGQLYGDALFLEHLNGFLQERPSVTSPPAPAPVPAVRRGLRFENVTFQYPGTDRPALTDFDLDLPAGKTVALVGENGAGKSTLVKLATRFYDPDRGRVTLDGVDVRDLAVPDYRRLVTVLFQFPVNYQATVIDSIGWGDPSTPPDRARATAAARAAGIDERIRALPGGYDAPLGRWFEGGQEMSGGEWQRLAMARAFYRAAPIVVLDEPTSMMDSWAEADWFDRFQTLAEGRVAVVITHRLTIARRADMIHVLHGGRVVESGTHDELLDLGGRYAASWSSQHGDDDVGDTAVREYAPSRQAPSVLQPSIP